VKEFGRDVLPFWHDTETWETDGRTDILSFQWQHRSLLHSKKCAASYRTVRSHRQQLAKSSSL